MANNLIDVNDITITIIFFIGYIAGLLTAYIVHKHNEIDKDKM